MKILKFGGTSVGSAARMKALKKIIPTQEAIVVLSAMSGTTNKLYEIAEQAGKGNFELARELIEALRTQYQQVIEELCEPHHEKQVYEEVVESAFRTMQQVVRPLFTKESANVVLAQGELLSTGLFFTWMKQEGEQIGWLPALSFMRINEDAEPDEEKIKTQLVNQLSSASVSTCWLTQGYICLNHLDQVDNLRRGGSDYSASLMGAAIGAEVVEIWTDISGFHNNDPRYVTDTKSLEELSFEEAAELAYFGAKILHPSSVLPAKKKGIPVNLRNTMEPDHPGTTIHAEAKFNGVRAIAAKSGITMINIRSGRMLLAYGFLRKVFEVFEQYKTPIDMITTSEVAVSLTIDNQMYIDKIIKELEGFGEITITPNQCIVSIVGQLEGEQTGVASKVFKALSQVSMKMISYGGSKYNVSVLIDELDKVKALNDLQEQLLNTQSYVS